MDKLRRKRASLPDQTQARGVLPKLDTDLHSGSGTSSPASSLDGTKGDFFQSIVPKALRSLSRSSTPRSPTMSDSPVFSPANRKVLQKSPSAASSRHGIGRRGSTSSEGLGRISRASTAISGSSTNSIDWRYQTVEKHAPLEPDPQSLRNKTGYVVITTDYVVIFKSKADAVAAFPHMVPGVAKGAASSEPLQVIPIQLVVAVFRAESSRPSFGLEIWWRCPYPAIAFSHTELFFNLPRERNDHMKCVLEMLKSKVGEADACRIPFEVEECIKQIFKSEEPGYPASEPEIFPVACRNCSPGDSHRKSNEKAKKSQESTSYYLAIGINLCFFVEIARASAVQEDPLKISYKTFGLVTLESFHGEWSPHEERFVLKFRDPFQQPVALELASRSYKQIALTLMKADKYLKPAWPTMWQTMEIFHISKLPEPRHSIAGEDFGGLPKTLTAYAAAYRCSPVEWEVNWRTELAPEFRVLPPREGGSYSALQLLAVLRALRYNDYFVSVSFNVDLSGLWGRYDSGRRGNIAYMNRGCVCLNSDESMVVQLASVLHQEIHALCFASETIQQLDFSGALKTYPRRFDETNESVQFLSPILNLLKMGLTNCRRIILRGCALGSVDVDDLAEALTPRLQGQGSNYTPLPQPAISLEVLDVAECGLSDVSLRKLFQLLPNTGQTLQILDVSGNHGRVSASIVSSFAKSLTDMRSLNLSNILMGSISEALISYETLSRLGRLEELNLSGWKLNDASQRAIDKHLLQLSARQASPSGMGSMCALRLLVLNNCGVTGYGAGRMFNAMTGLRDVHLYLNGNPLETGIDQLAHSIGLCWKGKFGLHMDMVEFRDEANYIKLLKSLAVNKHIEFLSLVGTAPTPTEEATCSAAMCHALEQLFTVNKSIRFLDMSGYSGKLDEGQLGQGFGRSLRGLAHNRNITHLHMRNQNLHEDAGTLGSALAENTTIRSLHFEDNNFNLTSLRFLVRSLAQNQTVVDCPVTLDEQRRILAHCLKDVPQRNKPKKKGAVDTVADAQEALLRNEIEQAVAELAGYVKRNRATVESQTGFVMDFADTPEAGGRRGWPSLELRMPDGATPTDAAQALALAVEERRRTIVRSSSMPPETAVQAPYHVPHDDDGLLSPASAATPSSELPATPEEEYQSSGYGGGGEGEGEGEVSAPGSIDDIRCKFEEMGHRSQVSTDGSDNGAPLC